MANEASMSDFGSFPLADRLWINARDGAAIADECLNFVTAI